MPKATKTAPKPQPASVAALPQYAPQDVAFRAPAIPPVPHSFRLQIVRAQGGFILFAAEHTFDQADADPCDAIGVASTVDDLIRRIRDWTNAKPEPSVDANI